MGVCVYVYVYVCVCVCLRVCVRVCVCAQALEALESSCMIQTEEGGTRSPPPPRPFVMPVFGKGGWGGMGGGGGEDFVKIETVYINKYSCAGCGEKFQVARLRANTHTYKHTRACVRANSPSVAHTRKYTHTCIHTHTHK